MSGEPGIPGGGDQRALIARLRAVIEARDTENALLRAELEAQLERYRCLELRVAELERRLGSDSTNSGIPPSKDPIGARERRKAGRKKERQSSERERRKDRKRGGQPGHPGAGLLRDPDPDEQAEVPPPAECSRCGTGLEGAQRAGTWWSQVWDVKITRFVTEYLLPLLACPCCGKVNAARGPGQSYPGSVSYGPGINTAAVLLSSYGNVPSERAANLIGMLLGMPVSAGFVDLASERLSARLEDAGFDDAMQAALGEEPVLAADETPVNLLDPHAELAEADAGTRPRLPSAWWVSAADRASLTGGLVTVARQIGASSADIEAIEGDAGDAPDRLWTLLDQVRRPWLLVLDNADDPSVLGQAASTAHAADAPQRASAASPADGTGWLRRAAHGLVVVTSRDGSSSAWGRHARIVHIDPLEEGDGARVLLDRAPRAGTEPEARDLARRLGGLPLALHLAGSYLSSEAALLRSFREYLLALDDLGSRHRLLTSRPDLDAPADERQILVRTWELSLDTLSRNGTPQARPLLRVLSCYAPARPIPLWLLTPTGLSRLLTGAKAARRPPADQAVPAYQELLAARRVSCH